MCFVFALLIPERAFAAAKNEQDSICYSETVLGIEIAAITGSEKVVEIPETINGKTVIAFEPSRISNNVETIKIPKTVKYISNINDLRHYDSDCRLISFEVDNDNENFCSIDGVIYNKTGTTLIWAPYAKTDITFPDTVEKIQQYAFAGSHINNIVLPDTIKEIENSAFKYCKELKTISLPDNLTEISSYTFFGCSNLEKIEIPKGVQDISLMAFGYCSNLSSVIYAGDRDKITVWKDAYIFCNNWEEGTNPSKYSIIDLENTEYKYREINGEIYIEVAFSDNKTVKIPEQIDGKPVTRLDNMDLQEGVEKLIIPKSVKKIILNYYALQRNTTLKNVVVDSDNTKYKSKSGVVYTKSGKTLVWVPSSRESFTIPKSVTRIGQSAFATSSIKDIKIPDTVKYIEDNAFCYCPKLQSVTLPKKLKTISNGLFSYCSKLKKIEIPANVTKISRAFVSCNTLKEVTFASGSKLKKIDTKAFSRIKNKSKLVFKAKKNSYAYKWAKKKGFKVKSL
jgi:hypothetical protein